MIERYTNPEMGNIWALQHEFEVMLDVEIAACEAMAELGEIPKEAAELILEDLKKFREVLVRRAAEFKKWVQRNAMKRWLQKEDFRTNISKDEDITKYLTQAEIDECFKVDYFLRHVDMIMTRFGL